jgi:hypothetical protein
VGRRALSAAAAAAAVVLVLAVGGTGGAPIAAQSGPPFDALSATQQRLLAGLATPPSLGTNQPTDARAMFDGADASFRDAFATITAALASLSLSDHENGEILGVALDLVDGVEPLARQPEAGGGDERAQLSVTLAPGARDRLRRSAEFAPDSGGVTPSHPAAYLQTNSPSLRFALDATGTRARISIAR